MDHADQVFVNANVTTVDDARPTAQAIAIRGDRFLFVGTNQEAQAWIGPQTRVTDLRGKAIVPGLIDSHVHLEWYGRVQEEVQLQGTRSFEEVLARVAKKANETPRGNWIIGMGWDESDWVDRTLPTHHPLSEITPHHPVWLGRIGGHSGLANARAMEIAKITRDTPDLAGGEIVRDVLSRLPTGVLVDAATDLVETHLPPVNRQDRVRRILRAIDDAVAVGLTGVHDARGTYETIEIFKSLADQGKLKLRVYAMIGGYDTLFDDYFKTPRLIGYGNHHLTFRAIKMGMDGAMGSRGALLFEDYSDRPGHRGFQMRSPEELIQVALAALRNGFQLNVHAIGDKGNRLALNAFEEALKQAPVKDHRFRVEHAQLVSLDDIPRFVKLGVIPAMQQTHCTSDMPWVYPRVGPERSRGAYAWRKFLDSGSIVAGGSDFPVESNNPLWGIYAAVTRQTHEGEPPGGWHPEERMTMTEALKSFTLWAAYAAFEEDLKGSITPGKLADFVVLSKDIMRLPPQELLTTQILQTVVGGKTVYEAHP